MSRRRQLSLPLIALTALAACTGQTTGADAGDATPSFDTAAVDAVVEGAMEQSNIPGVAVSIVRGGDVLLAKGYGLASIEHGVLVEPKTMFQSGSVGKMFTAAGVMLLVEDGLLDLDVSIRAYIPEGPATWDDITLRHLLSHTSGIPDYTSDALDYTRQYEEADLVQLSSELELEFPPGARWNYSNTGYVLLGIITTRVAGRPYWELLRERLFDPVGMPAMRVNFATDIVPHRASGYELEDDELRNQAWVSPSLNSTADGSLLMSLEDMIAWNEAVRTRSVLAAESWDQILTPVTLNSGNTYPYGFGWSVTTVGDHLVHQHGGGWQGFRTQFTRYVEPDVAIIVLANASHADPDAIAVDVAKVLDASFSGPPPATTPIEDPDPQATAFVASMLDKASRGELELSDFSFVRQTSFPYIRDTLAERLESLGAPDRLELLERKRRGDDQRLRYRAWYGERQFRVSASIGPEGGLTGLWATVEE